MNTSIPDALLTLTPDDDPNDTRQQLDEERDAALVASWFTDAKQQTPETLAAFFDRLMYTYRHDYGTSCRAVAACAVAAAHAANDVQGLTGFQAGFVFWDFYRHWMHEDGPAQLINYSHMLYPQYAHSFDRVISRDTWEYLQSEARAKLDQVPFIGVDEVREHWQSIVDGDVPFGYRVDGDEVATR